jgi:hypothetical protein
MSSGEKLPKSSWDGISLGSIEVDTPQPVVATSVGAPSLNMLVPHELPPTFVYVEEVFGFNMYTTKSKISRTATATLAFNLNAIYY